MRYRREQNYQGLGRKHQDDDCSWNNIIVWGICISVIVLVILYVSFGPALYHPPPILVGSETVSALDSEKKSIPVYEGSITVDTVGSIFYRYTEPRGRGSHLQPDVLLLHGAKYGSAAWKGLGTLQIFSYWGYRTIAIDLPGYKLSKKANTPTTHEAYKTFMEHVVNQLKLTKVVIIAPSMSGDFALPVLLEDNTVDLRGFVAIAPKGTNAYSKQQYQSVQVPVLVMYGERDKTAYKEESVYWMENIPDHTNVMIQKAEHAAWVGNPEDFHKEILRFLATRCQVGQDTETDNAGDDMYDDELFGGYGGNDFDTDTDYYDDTDTNAKDTDFQEYLQNYFADDEEYGDYNDEEYYDDTELYFDNKDLTDETDDEYAGIDTATDTDTT
eukprot:102508_1